MSATLRQYLVVSTRNRWVPKGAHLTEKRPVVEGDYRSTAKPTTKCRNELSSIAPGEGRHHFSQRDLGLDHPAALAVTSTIPCSTPLGPTVTR